MKIKLTVILLFLVSCLHSQSDVRRIQSYDNNKKINFTQRYNEYVLAFKSPLCCDDDTIFVGIISDSIGVDLITFNPYAYFPKNINPINSTMILNYTDGTDEILYQIGFPDEDNYVAYFVVSRKFDAIFNKKVKSITFRGIGNFKVKDKTYFTDFYNQIKQR